MASKLAKKRKFKDSDGDGLSDYDEINIFGSDPHDEDTDGDGIEDGEAVLNGKHPVSGEKLKNYFLPYPSNNYEPKFFSYKRLIFHVASIILIKLSIFIFIFFYPIIAWMSFDLATEEGRSIIFLTNALREKLNLNLLVESQELNQAAIKKIDDMFINQYFAHLSPQGLDSEHFIKLSSYKDYIMIGENLALGFSKASKVMTAWEDSPTHYDNLVDPNFREIGVALANGIYKDRDTFLVAQYFGLSHNSPLINNEQVNQDNNLNKKEKFDENLDENLDENSDGKEVLSNKIIDKNNMQVEHVNNLVERKDAEVMPALVSENIDNTKINAIEKVKIIPVLENYKTKIVIDEPIGAKKDKMIRVEADLPSTTLTASLDIFNNNIKMEPIVSVFNVNNQYNKWTGQAIVQDNSDSFAPPIITLNTNLGETQKVNVVNNNIKQKKSSLISQYLLFKNNPNYILAKIFNISLMYYKIIFVLAFLILLPNFFVPIKKIKAKIILPGLCFMLFLAFMIIF
jgi:hypothetical protein